MMKKIKDFYLELKIGNKIIKNIKALCYQFKEKCFLKLLILIMLSF